MAIYYLDVKTIGRSSGRSSVAAAVYRSGEELRSVTNSAAYRAGEKLSDELSGITYDYTKKTGVVHSEILLPRNAPDEYRDRETLWNTVEHSEKRVDARTAREVVVALPIEFNLQEQITLLKEYVTENFVKDGMCADFSIHDKGDGNPHAHILLTTRHVAESGFLTKNRDWDKKEKLLGWRENWAVVCNHLFEQKGLDERIDHRTLEAQGIDREPTIHMGHAATAMERRGIKTERGNRNREIIERNKRRAAAKMTESMSELQKSYIKIDGEIRELQRERNRDRQEIQKLNFRAEQIEEHATNIRELRGKIDELQAERKELRFWHLIRKRDADRAIKQLENASRQAHDFFRHSFHIEAAEAPAEIERIKREISGRELALKIKSDQISALLKNQNTVEAEHRKTIEEIRRNQGKTQENRHERAKPKEKVRTYERYR